MSRVAQLALLALVLVAIVGGMQMVAKADGPYCGGCGGWGINYPYGLYGNRINDIPYYALFPPVYYSHPVPRTYGWSPFAYPPGTMTPEVPMPEPQDIINPYVPQPQSKPPAKASSAKSTAHTASYRPAPTPQVIINPYVSSARVATASN